MNSNPKKPADEPGRLSFSDKLARTVLNSLSAHIAILDEGGVILETNDAWREYAVENGMPESHDHRGENYLEICDASSGTDAEDARKVSEGIRSVILGDIDEFLFDYPCHSPEGPHWYYMRVIRTAEKKPVRIVVSHEDITALKLTEESLRESKEALDDQKQSLEEANIALKVILKQRDQDRLELEGKILNNVKELVFPYVEKLKYSPLKAREKTLVEIIGSHLEDIISPFLKNFTNARLMLTPQEMQVATLVRDGKTSKEIADLLNVAETTVNFHRKNLRDKFGLKNTQTNLRLYLLSIS